MNRPSSSPLRPQTKTDEGVSDVSFVHPQVKANVIAMNDSINRFSAQQQRHSSIPILQFLKGAHVRFLPAKRRKIDLYHDEEDGWPEFGSLLDPFTYRTI